MIKQQFKDIIALLKEIVNNPSLNIYKDKISHIITEFEKIENNIGDIIPSFGLRRHLNKLNESLTKLSLNYGGDEISEIEKIFYYTKLFSISLMFEQSNILFKKSSDITDVERREALQNQAENISHNASLLIENMLSENMTNIPQMIETLKQSIVSMKNEVNKLQELTQVVQDIANIVSIFDNILSIVSIL